jgi:hypothetical protein
MTNFGGGVDYFAAMEGGLCTNREGEGRWGVERRKEKGRNK